MISFALVLVLVFFVLLVLVTLHNLYLYLRRKIPVNVNCWFCNVNSYVSSKNRNSWLCDKCQQYNGFDENGDYNCDISNQYFEFLNPTVYCQYDDKWKFKRSNGLCSSCNHKQSIKVQLLADFVPKNDAHFDYEVEEYANKLEELYAVCSKCCGVVDQALNNSKTVYLEQYMTHIKTRGLNLSNLSLRGKNHTLLRSFVTMSKLVKSIFSVIYIFRLFLTLNNHNSYIYNIFLPYVQKLSAFVLPYFNNLNDEYKLTLLFDNIYNDLGSMDIYLKDLFFYTFDLEVIFNCENFTLSLISVEILLCTCLFYFDKLYLELCQLVLWFLSLVMHLNLVRSLYLLNEMQLKDLKILVALVLCLLSVMYRSASSAKISANKVLGVLSNGYVCEDNKNKSYSAKGKQESIESTFHKQNRCENNENSKLSREKNGFNSNFSEVYSRNFNKGSNKVPLFRHSFNYENSKIGNTSFRTTDINYDVTNSSAFRPVSSYKNSIDDFGLSNLHLSKKGNRSFSPLSCNSLFSTRKYKPNNNSIFTEPKMYKASIIAPSRLEKSLLQPEVLSDNYWSQSRKFLANMNYTFSPISRTSSQSSGFESQISGSCYNTASSPPSRESSVCDDFDDSSVLSEPAYYSNNYFQQNRSFNSNFQNPVRLLDDEVSIPCRLPKHDINLYKNMTDNCHRLSDVRKRFNQPLF